MLRPYAIYVNHTLYMLRPYAIYVNNTAKFVIRYMLLIQQNMLIWSELCSLQARLDPSPLFKGEGFS